MKPQVKFLTTKNQLRAFCSVSWNEVEYNTAEKKFTRVASASMERNATTGEVKTTGAKACCKKDGDKKCCASDKGAKACAGKSN